MRKAAGSSIHFRRDENLGSEYIILEGLTASTVAYTASRMPWRTSFSQKTLFEWTVISPGEKTCESFISGLQPSMPAKISAISLPKRALCTVSLNFSFNTLAKSIVNLLWIDATS
jgi:hypothetical protein